MRDQIINAIKQHAEGHIAKHKANVEVLLQKTAGIAEITKSFLEIWEQKSY